MSGPYFPGAAFLGGKMAGVAPPGVLVYEGRNYFARESRCRCGCGHNMDADTLDRFNILRSRCGFPLAMSSGFRCKAHNDSIGGAPNSAHLHGLAGDIKPGRRGYEVLQAALEPTFDGFLFRRVLAYPWGFHFDCTPTGGHWGMDPLVFMWRAR